MLERGVSVAIISYDVILLHSAKGPLWRSTAVQGARTVVDRERMKSIVKAASAKSVWDTREL